MRAFPVAVESGQDLAKDLANDLAQDSAEDLVKGPYVAEIFPVHVEDS